MPSSPAGREDVAFDIQSRGSLVISGRPGTRVIALREGQPRIELGKIGPTGEENFAGLLPQGRYSIVLDHPDLQPEMPPDIQIDPAKTTRMTARQVAWTSTLDVRSDPPGATVSINGASRGTTPTVINDLPSGTPFAVEVTLRGKKPYTKTVTLRPRENGTLFVDRFAPEVPEQRQEPPSIANTSQQGASPGQAAARAITPAQYEAAERTLAEAEAVIREGKGRAIIPPDADKAGGVKFAGKHTTQNVIETMKSVAQRRGWTVVKVEGDVVMLNLKNRGYDATVSAA